MNGPEVAVECHSGHAYAGEPRVVVWQGQRQEVEAVVARWRLPEGPAFRVLTAAGCLFDLYYNEGEDSWAAEPREVSNETCHCERSEAVPLMRDKEVTCENS